MALSAITFLKVGFNPTEGELLIALLARHFEIVVGKLSTVTVVMLDPDAVLGGESFECLLGFYHF
jgi:hypothetical protein